MDNTVLDIKQDLMSLFRQKTGILEKGSGSVLNLYREQAFHDFDKLGIPTSKHEAYKYTPVENYLKGNYDIELESNPFKIDIKDVFKCDIPQLDTHVVLVLNGFYYNGNQPDKLPGGLIICGLREASVRFPGIFQKHYSKYADTTIDGLIALNTLFAQDGVFVYLPKGITLDKPVQIINLSHSVNNLRVTRRNLIVVEDHANANIVVCDHTLGNNSYLINSLTEVYLGANASLDYSRLENENVLSAQINNLFVHQQENSRLVSNIICLHGGLVRNNFYTKLSGVNADSNLYGLFLSDESQHMANYVLVDHASPYCTSNQLFKGILDDKSTGSFNGKILVEKDAQKTQAYQKNNNILLSTGARMNSKPHLEIYADDVKCSHGATIGRLDNEAMFYLRTRGISEKEARHLLMYAFANEIVSKIRVEALRERVIDLVDKRLRGELSRCKNCEINCG